MMEKTPDTDIYNYLLMWMYIIASGYCSNVLLVVFVAPLVLYIKKLNWSFVIKLLVKVCLKYRPAVLYQIGYVYQFENIIQYWLSEYWQNVIAVQH